MSNDADEIEKLLKKIDKDTERIKYLETLIEFEQKSKQALERRLLVLEELQAKSSYQQSRMLRERDSMVREMSVEIDTISTRLKNSVNENVDWKKRYKKLEKIYEELEIDFANLKKSHENIQKQVSQKKIEIKQIGDVMELYKNLKKDVQMKERWNQQEKNLIQLKAKEISSNYSRLKEDLEYSQDKLKKMIMRNSRVPLEIPNKKLQKTEREMLEQKIFMLTKDNLYLKKELLSLIKKITSKSTLDLNKDNASKEKVKGFQDVMKDETNLNGSILSFSNNNINENLSLDRINSKSKFMASPDQNMKQNDEIQGSAVINIKKFRLIQSKKYPVPKQSASLQVSHNKSKLIPNYQIPSQCIIKVKSKTTIKQRDYSLSLSP
jgi:chromosome segregation ATPase